MPAYGDDLSAIHAAGFAGPAIAAARELLARLPDRAQVVDLGCGDGTTAELLTAAGHDVLGIDASEPMIALARRRAPRAAFRVGSFVDAELPTDRDAIVAVGEVLGYRPDRQSAGSRLDRVLARAAGALRRGGLMLFDLAGPDRIGHRSEQRDWHAGEGWAVLVRADVAGGELRRRIVSFRDPGDGRFRRTEETHRLRLHAPADVLAALRAVGFAARTLPGGYAGEPLPRGLTAYVARKR